MTNIVMLLFICSLWHTLLDLVHIFYFFISIFGIIKSLSAYFIFENVICKNKQSANTSRRPCLNERGSSQMSEREAQLLRGKWGVITEEGEGRGIMKGKGCV